MEKAFPLPSGTLGPANTAYRYSVFRMSEVLINPVSGL
jgi:hypothetical protein